jgi:hypothetical protein
LKIPGSKVTAFSGSGRKASLVMMVSWGDG